jgi:hypothetical protein
MKKILFIILFLLFATKGYCTTYTAVAAGGDWQAAGTWDVGSGYPVAGDTVNINATCTGTVSLTQANACAVLNLTNNGGTLAFGNYVLTCTGNVTLGGAITAGTGGLTITGASTMNSGGVTFPGKLVFNYVGLVTFSAATNLNKTAAETLTCNGGLTATSVCSGTATIIIGGTGGVVTGTGIIYSNLTFNCTSATIATGNFTYSTGTMTYTAGTITVTSGSALRISGSCALNTNGIIWDDVTFGTAAPTVTLGSNFTCSIIYLAGSRPIFAGAYNITCDTLTDVTTVGTTNTLTLEAGQTLTVTTNLYLSGIVTSNTATTQLTIRSDASPSTTNLVYQGTTANCKVFGVIFTDINASGSAQGIDNWYGGTLTNCTNITNRTSADIGGGGTGSMSVSTNF